jgi:hypothetical protein
MAYVPSAVAHRDLVVESPARIRPGLFRRLLDAMMQSRQRQADREIARYLQNSKFTDEAEREIERFFLSTPTRF